MFNETEYNRKYMRQYRANNRNGTKEKSKAYSKRYYKDNKVYCNRASLNSRLKRKFGLTVSKRDTLIKAQGYRCKVCLCLFTKVNRACIDHNHTTGRMRGIICTMCNKALGLFKDDTNSLIRAIEYLKA